LIRVVRLFRVFIPASVVILLISEALIITAAYVIAAFLNPEGDAVTYLIYGNGPVNIALVLVTILLGLYLNDLYSDVFVKSHVMLMQQLCFVLGAAFLIQGVVSYVDRDLRMPLHVMAPGSAIALLGIYGWRLLFSSVVVNAMGGDRLLLLGNSHVLSEIVAHIATHPEKGVQVIGYLTDDPDVQMLAPAKYLGHVESLREIVKATNPTRIVVGMKERRNRLPVPDLLELRYTGNLIEEALTTYERVCGRVCMKELRPSQLIYSGEFSRRRREMFYHNASNLAMASLCLLLSAPLLLLTALAVRLTSAGPVLYRQRRVGMDGVPFTLYKFRSMSVDAEKGTGAVWAAKDDPRVTPVGRFIRKVRLDELPQLLNVLKGEMSMVGPRPERPEFVRTLAEQIPYYRQRHAVRPGITGWAQINFKYGDTLQDTVTKLEYDLYYIKNMSFSMDAYIVFHTLKAMLLSRGAQ
jgi:sugar transferase (PEP-CTERM system associated)